MKIIEGREYKTGDGEVHKVYRNPNENDATCYWLSETSESAPCAWYEDGRYWKTETSGYDFVEEVISDPWTTDGTKLALKHAWNASVHDATAVVNTKLIPDTLPEGLDIKDFVAVEWTDRDKFGYHAQQDGCFLRSAFYLVDEETPEIDVEEVEVEDEIPADMIEPGVWTPGNDGSNMDGISVPVMVSGLIDVSIDFKETSQAVTYRAMFLRASLRPYRESRPCYRRKFLVCDCKREPLPNLSVRQIVAIGNSQRQTIRVEFESDKRDRIAAIRVLQHLIGRPFGAIAHHPIVAVLVHDILFGDLHSPNLSER